MGSIIFSDNGNVIYNYLYSGKKHGKVKERLEAASAITAPSPIPAFSLEYLSRLFARCNFRSYNKDPSFSLN
jgi:hypothetical protein